VLIFIVKLIVESTGQVRKQFISNPEIDEMLQKLGAVIREQK
jgi:hypothetical protein